MTKWSPSRPVRESKIEAVACARAEAQGWTAIKVGKNGWPDRVFIGHGLTVWIEFKVGDNGLTALQARRHKTIKERGGIVETCWTVDEAMTALNYAWREKQRRAAVV